MDTTKDLQRLKIIGLILICLGGLTVFSNGISYLVLRLNDFSFDKVIGNKAYLSPLYLFFSGAFVMISGFLFLKLKKIGFIFIQISTSILTILFTISNLNTVDTIQIDGDLRNITMIGSIILSLLFIIPLLLLIYYLNKPKIKINFT